MKKHKWINLEIFCDQYDISSKTLYARKHLGSISECVFKKVSPKKVLIDENFFLRRKKFKDKVVSFSQDMYYLLTSKFSELQIARAVATYSGVNMQSAYAYINENLFKPPYNNPLLNTKLHKHQWVFYRFCRSVIRGLERSIGRKIKLEYELDLLMGEIR